MQSRIVFIPAWLINCLHSTLFPDTLLSEKSCSATMAARAEQYCRPRLGIGGRGLFAASAQQHYHGGVSTCRILKWLDLHVENWDARALVWMAGKIISLFFACSHRRFHPVYSIFPRKGDSDISMVHYHIFRFFCKSSCCRVSRVASGNEESVMFKVHLILY